MNSLIPDYWEDDGMGGKRHKLLPQNWNIQIDRQKPSGLLDPAPAPAPVQSSGGGGLLPEGPQGVQQTIGVGPVTDAISASQGRSVVNALVPGAGILNAIMGNNPISDLNTAVNGTSATLAAVNQAQDPLGALAQVQGWTGSGSYDPWGGQVGGSGGQADYGGWNGTAADNSNRSDPSAVGSMADTDND